MKMTTENEAKLLDSIKDLMNANRNLNNELETANDALESTEKQLKQKYSNDDFILIDRHSFNKVIESIDGIKTELRCVTDDIEDIEYQYLSDISNSLSDASCSISDAETHLEDLESDLEALATPTEEEVKEVKEALKVAAKKTPAKKTSAVKVVVKNGISQ